MGQSAYQLLMLFFHSSTIMKKAHVNEKIPSAQLRAPWDAERDGSRKIAHAWVYSSEIPAVGIDQAVDSLAATTLENFS